MSKKAFPVSNCLLEKTTADLKYSLVNGISTNSGKCTTDCHKCGFNKWEAERRKRLLADDGLKCINGKWTLVL